MWANMEDEANVTVYFHLFYCVSMTRQEAPGPTHWARPCTARRRVRWCILNYFTSATMEWLMWAIADSISGYVRSGPTRRCTANAMAK